jgi:hypothetical protein
VSRKDYVAAAAIVRAAAYLEQDAREQLVLELAEWFRADNPRFRPDMFFAAALGDGSSRVRTPNGRS